MSIDIHNKQRELELNNNAFKTSEHVSQADKQAVQKFCTELSADGISDSRVSKYVSNLHSIMKLAPDHFELTDADEDDLKLVAAAIKRTDLSEATKSDFRVAIKKFYLIMEGDPNKKIYPEKIEFISTKRDNSKIPEKEILSKQQIDEIIDLCKNDRDRAMYKLLYEGGLRPGELIALNRGDIDFVKNGVKIKVPPIKTGDRKILVVESERYLRTWLQKHPFEDRKDVPLFTDIRMVRNKTPEEVRVGYDHMRLNLKKMATELDLLKYQDGFKEADEESDNKYKRDENGDKIPKFKTDVVPYTFRHSRATHLATELTEATMKEYFGWTQSSDMAKHYIHLSGKHVEEEIMDMYGIQPEGEENEKKECGRCYREYKGDEQFCPRCGMAFDQKVAKEEQELHEAGMEVLDERVSDMSREDLEKRVKLLAQGGGSNE